MVERLTRVDLRDVWPHEAWDFTEWLRSNTDVLSEQLPFEITGAESEAPAGQLNVDIVAETEEGGSIVIENQLGRSDHDHLGKLITYLSLYEADTAIWVVRDARAEHTSAVSWLNETYDAAFYLFKIEAVRIGDSEPAPLFTQIVGPSEELSQAGQKKQFDSERRRLRYEFFDGLLRRAQSRTDLFTNISPKGRACIGASRKGIKYRFCMRQQGNRVGVYIDVGDPDENRQIFERLRSEREQIEEEFGQSLSWDELETKRACRVEHHSDRGGWGSPEDEWTDIQQDMVNRMVRLEQAVSPVLVNVR